MSSAELLASQLAIAPPSPHGVPRSRPRLLGRLHAQSGRFSRIDACLRAPRHFDAALRPRSGSRCLQRLTSSTLTVPTAPIANLVHGIGMAALARLLSSAALGCVSARLTTTSRRSSRQQLRDEPWHYCVARLQLLPRLPEPRSCILDDRAVMSQEFNFLQPSDSFHAIFLDSAGIAALAAPHRRPLRRLVPEWLRPRTSSDPAHQLLRLPLIRLEVHPAPRPRAARGRTSSRSLQPCAARVHDLHGGALLAPRRAQHLWRPLAGPHDDPPWGRLLLGSTTPPTPMATIGSLGAGTTAHPQPTLASQLLDCLQLPRRLPLGPAAFAPWPLSYRISSSTPMATSLTSQTPCASWA